MYSFDRFGTLLPGAVAIAAECAGTARSVEPFERSFGHVARRGAFRRYLLGLLSDSRWKSMSAMWERVHDSGTYQAFQHFISHAPWDHARIWRQVRAAIPDRDGVLILDVTSFPKQGTQSVGVARQYCGTFGKVANCQVAVTARNVSLVSRSLQAARS